MIFQLKCMRYWMPTWFNHVSNCRSLTAPVAEICLKDIQIVLGGSDVFPHFLGVILKKTGHDIPEDPKKGKKKKNLYTID